MGKMLSKTELQSHSSKNTIFTSKDTISELQSYSSKDTILAHPNFFTLGFATLKNNLDHGLDLKLFHVFSNE